MDEKSFATLKDRISKAINKISIMGVKGKQVHEILRNAIISYEIKKIVKGEKHIEKAHEDFESYLQEHLLSKVEKSEEKFILEIIKELTILYTLFLNIAIFEKQDIDELLLLEKTFEKKGVIKEARGAIKKVVEEWKTELADFRKDINAIFTESRGRQELHLALFNKLHTDDNLIARMRERSLWKDAIKDEHLVEKNVDKFNKVKNKKEFEDLLKTIAVEEEKMTQDYTRLHKYLFDAWSHVDKLMDNFVVEIAKAADSHEVPARDNVQFRELKAMILNHVVEKLLHSLRIVDKQLEAEIEEVAKAA